MSLVLGRLTDHALASDARRLSTLFGDSSELLPLWIAEPYVDLAPGIRASLEARANVGWYGYESRPRALIEAFWEWMSVRHAWEGSYLHASVSPSVGTSIGVLLENLTQPGDGVILQPPVFTDFKPLIVSAGRSVVRSALSLTADGYRMDLKDLEVKTADPGNRVLVLCNPHNPVGRLWTQAELEAVADVCAANNVFVISDEIHADLALPGQSFTPFATAAAGSGVSWAATHGPIKTFGLAGVCDTLLVTDDDRLTADFQATSSRLHLTRNNVFAMSAFETAYRTGADWLDGFLELIAGNTELLERELPDGIDIIRPEATYLAWLDFRQLSLGVPELVPWLAAAGLALSPGHWFGREGAGFARMTIAAPRQHIEEAIKRLTTALG